MFFDVFQYYLDLFGYVILMLVLCNVCTSFLTDLMFRPYRSARNCMLRVEVDSKVTVGIQLPLIESSSIAMYRSSIASNSLNSDQNDQVPA